MSNLSKTAKDIIRNIAVIGAAEAILGVVLIIAVFDSSYISGHILGIILGSAASALRIIQLEKSINKSLGMGEKTSAVRYFRFLYLFRALITAMALGLALWAHPAINFASVAVGLLNMTLGAYTYKLFNKE